MFFDQSADSKEENLFFSIIIPVYNRPQEIKELLDSLILQTFKNFEVIIVEDGSSSSAKEVVDSLNAILPVSYYYKVNEGQGIARNYAFERSKGDFFIVLDSDVIVPPDYLEKVSKGIFHDNLDAFGGADAAADSFTDLQKAISYSMTSPLTTGGIRGGKKRIGVFHPRSFNMGISRKVWEKTAGFKLARRSEDIEFSVRMIQNGFKVGLISEAFVYHKRRTDAKQFFKQIFGFGMGRIDIYRLYPEELKLVHLMPAIFVVGVFTLFFINLSLIFGIHSPTLSFLAYFGNVFLIVYSLLLFVHAWICVKSIRVAAWSLITSYIQLFGYGLGLIYNFIKVPSN